MGGAIAPPPPAPPGYATGNIILFPKSKLKNCDNGKFNKAFITEDLTLLRSKLVNYIKKDCDETFVLDYTYNGKMRMKRSAREQSVVTDDQGSRRYRQLDRDFALDDLFRLMLM